jgi:hypothetical protein
MGSFRDVEAWSVPIGFTATKLNEIGFSRSSLGARCWPMCPDNAPEGWGARAILTFLFPTGS